LAEAEPPAGGRAFETRRAPERRSDPVGRDDEARLERSGARLEADASRAGSRLVDARPDLDKSSHGARALGERRGERRAPNAEPRPSSEATLDGCPVLLDVADPEEGRAVVGAYELAHPESLERPHAAREETFAARLVRSLRRPLEEHDREPAARG